LSCRPARRWMCLRNSAGSHGSPSRGLSPETIWAILSGRNVFSVSMIMADPPRPPISCGSWTFTASWWPTCVFPDPNSPYSSTIDWVSIPPPKSSLKLLLPVFTFPTSLRRSRTRSPVSNPPMSAASLAAAMILSSRLPDLCSRHKLARGRHRNGLDA